jgi:hypothetical protein
MCCGGADWGHHSELLVVFFLNGCQGQICNTLGAGCRTGRRARSKWQIPSLLGESFAWMATWSTCLGGARGRGPAVLVVLASGAGRSGVFSTPFFSARGGGSASLGRAARGPAAGGRRRAAGGAAACLAVLRRTPGPARRRAGRGASSPPAFCASSRAA